MSLPLVTIMIPTYNQEKYIDKCIRSALAQSYPYIEIIISDDSTNRETQQHIKKHYAKDVIYIHHSPSLGRVKNYYTLLHEYAKGEWVLNLDGDDYLSDNTFIEKAIDMLMKEKKAVLVFARQALFDLSLNKMTREKSFVLEEGIHEGNSIFLDTIYKNIEIAHLATLYNRDKAMESGFYLSNIISTDRESLLKLLLDNKIIFIDDFVGVWNHHESNISKKMTTIDLIENISMYEKLYLLAKQKGTLNIFTLWRWQHLAIYKMIYSHSTKLMDAQKYKAVYATVLALLKKRFFIALVLLVDIRLYKRLCSL